MFKKIIGSKKRKELKKVRVSYDNGRFFVRLDGKKYDIKDQDDISTTKVLYSSPNNDRYIKWTKKKISKVLAEKTVKIEIVKEYWYKYRPGLIVKGEVVGNQFEVR